MTITIPISDQLRELRAAFNNKGFDIRFVGGCVRDALQGIVPQDIDLCTDAFPEEQLAIYKEAGVHHIETGIAHGTITVVLDQPYEITSLRTEDEHDGRHARMTYTRDWTEDLSRRDLTINAMALTFDGVLHDPFNGKDDLLNKRVRFVGFASERMEEDHLRILRYFRFLGRMYGEDQPLLEDLPFSALLARVHGLKNISVERVWDETKKILSHTSGIWVYPLMTTMGISAHTALPAATGKALKKFYQLRESGHSFSPAEIMCAFFNDSQHADQVARALKWTTDDRELAKAILSYEPTVTRRDMLFSFFVEGKSARHVVHAAKFHGLYDHSYEDIMTSNVFPVTGADLLERGIKPGPHMGKMILEMKTRWFNSSFQMNKEELLCICTS